jgi:hypothetical protein
MISSRGRACLQIPFVLVLAGLSIASVAEAHEPPQGTRLACVPLPKGGPVDVVRSLWADYPFNDPRPNRRPFWNESREVLARYFDSNAIEWFLAEQACQERWQGLCTITVDLLCACQDGDPHDHRFCRSDRGPNWVSVRFMNLGKETVTEVLTTKTSAGWRISDFAFSEGGSLVKTPHPP